MNRFQEDFFKKHNENKIITLLLKNGEPVRTNLFGNCMRPFIKNGEIVTIKPIKQQEVRCGDIVVYQLGERLKAHRYLRSKTISGTAYMIAKGDKSIQMDPPVSFDRLLGRVSEVAKGNRNISFENMKWKIINYILGKLSLSISIMKIPYYRIRKYIGMFLKFLVGERRTNWIKKVLHWTSSNS